jgi:hypothetical protein
MRSSQTWQRRRKRSGGDLKLYEQTIVLLGSTTDFAVVCQACESRGLGFGEEQLSLVRGKLGRGHDLGWTECSRGHRIRAIRAGRDVHVEMTSPLW